MSLLTLENIHSYYGHIHAIKGISVEVNEGEIVTLIGSNGAGKSTVLRTISGMMHPKEGKVIFDGKAPLPIPLPILGITKKCRKLISGYPDPFIAPPMQGLQGNLAFATPSAFKICFD